MVNVSTEPARRVHGGPDHRGAARHDFSTNGNACAPCPAARDAVRQADAGRYPDAGYAALRRQLAGFHGVEAWRVVLAASASEFIFRITALAAQAAPAPHTAHAAGAGGQHQAQISGVGADAGAGAGGAVWLPPHSYGDYAQAAHAHRLARVADPAQARLLWACEPSSPLGAAQPGLQALAEQRAARAWLVLDRAYEPLRLSGAPSLDAAWLQAVWQLFTPNKALGLTGVRAAYAIAPAGADDAVAALEQLCPSWPVGAHGVALLQAWTEPGVQAWLAASLATLRGWKARQVALCESLGWRCLPSNANFFCARPALPDGLSLQEALVRLRGQGIQLRDTASFGLPGHARLSVQPPAAQDALAAAWNTVCAS